MAISKIKNTDGTWDAIDTPGAVKFIEQSLTDEEKARARENIGISGETWTFTLTDGSTLTRTVYIG